MPAAKYFRAQAEMCLLIASQTSDPKTLANLNAEAARYHAAAAAIEEQNSVTQPRSAHFEQRDQQETVESYTSDRPTSEQNDQTETLKPKRQFGPSRIHGPR